MGPDNRGPLNIKLIAGFSFVGGEIVAQITVLETQSVKFAEIPG
jgi:hypothetical protein